MAADGSVIIDILADDSDFKKKTSSLGEKAGAAVKDVAKAAAAATVAIGAAVAGIATAAINAYADYEQLVGGVETLFGDSANVVQAYADNAYKTAGLSANAYMETVTSFSASLLQGLGGDTAEAAKVADMAITDMADNANKMGSSMESVQNAYQGFAKQNYTMLDNLKLGYGGTKTEMERLLADATALSGIQYNIENLNDVYEAIHVIQEEMGITGTTSLEASTTIQGSIATMKAAWQNMLVGLADDSQDFDSLLTNLIDSVGKVAENLIPRVKVALNGIADLAAALLPKVTALLPELAADLLPQLVEIAVSAVQTLAQGLADNAPLLASSAVGIMSTLVAGFLALLPELSVTALQLLTALAEGVAEALPTLVPAAVSAMATLAQGLIDNIPALITAAIQLMQGLMQGLLDAIPVLLEAAPTIITSLVDSLQEGIPQIIQAGVDLLVSLIGALPQIIQTIVAALPQIISSIINAVVSNIPLISQAGVQLLVALIQNLPQIIVEIVKAVPQIVSGIVQGFASFASTIADIGKDIVRGVWDGISGMASWIKDKVSGFFSGIVDGVKGLLGIKSPSRVFAKIGGYTMEGFADGVDDGAADNRKRVLGAAASLSDELAEALNTDATAQLGAEVNGLYHKMQLAVEAETGRVGAVAATQAENAAAENGAYSPPEPFDPAGVIMEIRQLKSQVAKGSTIVMDKRVVAQTVTEEQSKIDRATGR